MRGAHLYCLSMKRAILWLLALGLIAAVAVVGWRLIDERWFAATRFGEGSRTVNIPPGTGPHALGRLLADARVVSDANRFFTHLRWFRRNAHTKAGEYQFDGALLPDEVIGKLVRGEVKLYRFTAAEGLRADEIAPIVAATGLCTAPDFLKIVRDPLSPKKYGVPGPSLEGYLFPDTYSLPRGAGCAPRAVCGAWDCAYGHPGPLAGPSATTAEAAQALVRVQNGHYD